MVSEQVPIDVVEARPATSDLRDYGLLTAAVALLVSLMLRPWQGGWSAPIVYGNDTLSDLAMLDRVGWTGTARGSADLGAPYGLSWSDFPLGPDRVHMILIRFLRLFGGDPMLSLNLYFVLGFFLVAWASFTVLRALSVSRLVAGGVSIAFTIAPYHFARISDGHVFLAAYFAVPLGVLLAIWSSDGSITHRMSRARWIAVVAMVLVVGSASAYYAAFTIVLIAALGVAIALRRAEWRTLLVPVVLVASIGTVVVANTAGAVLAGRSAGTNLEASTRPTSDSDAFGLRLTQMISPMPDHRIDVLGQLGRRATQLENPGESGVAIGFLAIIGLACIATVCLRRVGRGEPSDTDPLMGRLGVMVLAAFGVATMGGLSLTLAMLGFGQIRVWSRMSIVIAFLGLTGLAVVLDRIRRTPAVASRQYGALLLVLALVTVALLDQTSVGSVPSRSANLTDQSVDRRVVDQMESELPAGSQVFELPYVGFPSAVPPGELPLYGLLGPWAAGTGQLEFSAAGMQGRGSDWQRSWTTRPPQVLLPGLAAAGFDAVYLDRRSELGARDGDTAQGSNTAAEADWLRSTLGAPSGGAPDGPPDREWFDLRPLRADLVSRWGEDRVRRVGEAVIRPIGIVYEGAADRFAVAGGSRLLLGDSTITLRDEAVGSTRDDGESVPVRVRFELSGLPGSTVRLDAAGRTRTIVLDDGPTPVELELPVERRDTEIRLRTDAPRLTGAGPQHGDVRLQVSQVQVIDADLDDLVTSDGFRPPG